MAVIGSISGFLKTVDTDKKTLVIQMGVQVNVDISSMGIEEKSINTT